MQGRYERQKAFQQTRRVLIIVLFLNFAVAAAKLAAGAAAASLALVADGWHSLFDGLSTVIALVGVTVAVRPPDLEHPYGHRRFEVAAALGIAFMLLLAAWEVVSAAAYRFQTGIPPRVSSLPFAVMAVTLLVNILVTRWESARGKQLASRVLLADAGHTRSDVYASLAVIAALAAAGLGYPAADFAVAALIGLIIARVGYKIIRDALVVLSDTAPIKAERILALFSGDSGLGEIHAVRTRSNGTEVYVDLHVYLPARMSVEQSHEITEAVEHRIKSAFPDVIDVVVHVEPESQKTIDRIAPH